MILPYGLRLLLLCSASFFVVYVGASLAVGAMVPALLRRSHSRVPRWEAAIFAAMRVLPLALALFAVAALCVPGYLRFEPEGDAERAGLLCTLAALTGAGIVLSGLGRAGGAAWRSFRSAREFHRAGQQIWLPGEVTPVTVLDSDAPLLALTGVARSRVVVSRSLLRALSPEQLEAAMRHEQAHRAAHDNGKRLLFLLAPDPFAPFGRLAALERAWARVAEWAADDRATGGDPRRALTLAETLVRVARMGRPQVNCALTAQLISDGSGLRERVNRLIELASHTPLPRSSNGGVAIPLSILAGLIVLAAAWQSPVLHATHRLLEALLH
jgi:hypothetical protein